MGSSGALNQQLVFLTSTKLIIKKCQPNFIPIGIFLADFAIFRETLITEQ